MRAPSARTIDFGGGLSLRFAQHPAAEYFMKRVLPKDGVHEPELVEYLKQTVRPRDVVVDIGAHSGYVSCIAAALGATVIAVEMQPTLIPMIQLNAALNDLWTVHPLCAAIGDRNGMVPSFRINPSPGTQSAVWHWERAKFPISSVNHDCIPCLTLDSLFPGPELPALVKVDVEGAEGRVLAGAGDLIGKRQTRFMVEVHAQLLPKYATPLADLLAPFDADGWTLSMLTTGGLRPLSREAFVDPEGPIARHAHNAPVLFEPRSG
jgi:FkbM family methyltransferase